MEQKKRIFSGMQPSGVITLGNYLGALKNWTKLQDEYDCLYCIVDMHAITVRQDPVKLRKQAKDLLVQYLAVGLDPEKNIIYYQSHVPQHAELAWILNCYTYMGELNRMTQFKDKSARHAENINAVPVGEDQRQHLELTRDIAQRFNGIYGDVFKVPDAYIGKVGARVMALQEPTKKMSKSDENQNNIITLMDDPKVIMNKMKRAMTDSDTEVRFAEEKPGISNLLSIYCAVTGKTIAEAEKEFAGAGYGTFKTAVGEAVVAELEPVQKRVKELEANKDYLDAIIRSGAEKASRLADRTLTKVQKKVGFPPRIR